jgi:hypothetical protein
MPSAGPIRRKVRCDGCHLSRVFQACTQEGHDALDILVRVTRALSCDL